MKKFFKVVFRFLRDYSFGLFIVGLILWYIFGSKFGPHLARQEIFRNFSSGYSVDKSLNYQETAPMMAQSRSFSKSMPKMISNDGFSGEIEMSERKQIRNGSLTLEVENTEDARVLVENEVTKLEGLISALNSWNIRGAGLAYNMTIRVPAKSLETLMKNLTQIGLKKAENFSVTDITAPYEDSENKLKNLRARRDRLRKMMEEKTEDLENILQIDRELANVQTQIENLVSVQNRRDTNIAYANLNLTLQPAPKVKEFQSDEWDITRTWKNAINDFIKDARIVVDKLVRLAVYTPIWLPALFIIWSMKILLFGKRKK